MFMSLLALLRGNTTVVLISGLLAGIIGFFSFQHLHILHLESELSTCHTISVALQQSNQQMLDALSQQNQAVATWKQESADKEAKAQAALAVAQKHAAIYAQKAANLMQQRSHAGGCQPLQQMIDNYFIRGQ